MHDGKMQTVAHGMLTVEYSTRLQVVNIKNWWFMTLLYPH